MKTSKQGILAALSLLLVAPAPRALAVVDQALQIQGTNLVLSWPSPSGYKQYLIQYRQTLDPSTPWTALTNAYPANSTTRSTYMIFGVVPSPSIVSGGGGTNFGGPPEPMSATPSEPTEPMVARADGTGSIVPLAIYPPGIDLSGFLIYDPAVSDWVNGSAYARPALSTLSLNRPQPLDPQPQDDHGATSGFFRVFHIPDWSFNVTNYTYDGPNFFPVDFADYMDRVQNIQVLLDGQPTGYAAFTSMYYGGQTNWGMGIYFDRIPSGVHQIQLVSTLHLNDQTDDDAVFLVLSNLTRSIVVDNQVVFANWDDTIWNNTNYTFRVQTKNNTTDWSIDIYDAWDNYVNGASGNTTNGRVECTWDLTDIYGNTRDSLSSDPFFVPVITFTDSLGHPTSRYTPVTLIPYPDQGDWLISFQDPFYDVGTSGRDDMLGAMTGIRGWVMYRNLWADYIPTAYGTNGYTQADRDSDWFTVKTILQRPECRNYYYYGHGNSNSIGGDLNSYDTNGAITGCLGLPHSKAYLTASIVKSDVTYNLNTGVHQFRFVWLDGCNTALGGWPDAFGVGKGTNDLSYYSNSTNNPSHLRPSAFVGWATQPGGAGWGNVQDYFFFRSEWSMHWSYDWQTESLVQALTDAISTSNWPPGGGSQLWGGLRAYGYNNLRMNEYNQKADWPGP